MTVPSSTSRDQQVGNGIATAFTVPFRILDQTYIRVLFTVLGVTTTKTLTTDYTVDGVGDANTTINFVAAPASGTTITFLRATAKTQETDYAANDSFPAESHENALDKLTMLVQELDTIAGEEGRTIKVPAETSGVSTELPAPVAAVLWGWNADRTAPRYYTAEEIATTAAYAGKLVQTYAGTGAQTAFILPADPGGIGNLAVFVDGLAMIPSVDYSYLGTTLTFTVAPALNAVIYVRLDEALAQQPHASAVVHNVGGTGAIDVTAAEKFRELSVTITEFDGVIGDGVTDCTAGIQAAIDYVASLGGGTVWVPRGVFQILSPIIGRSSVTVRGTCAQSKLRIGALSYFFNTAGTLSSDLTNTLAANAAVSSNSITLAAGKGANFAAGDYCLLTSEAAMPQGGCTNKRGEIVRVQGVVGDVVTLESPIIYTFNTADTARLRKITTVNDFALVDLAIDGDHNANSATFRRSQTVFQWCLRPRVIRCRFRDLGQQAIIFGGCIGGVVESCQFDDLDSDDASQYGYALLETAANIGNRMINCTAERVRHVYTTTDTSTPFSPGYGQPSGTLVLGCNAIWPRAAAFDNHEAGLDQSFRDCTVTGGQRMGFQVRALRTVISNCTVTDCIGEAVYIDSSAEDTVVQGLTALRTNSGTVLGTDRRDRGAIFDNGLRSRVVDCRIELCGGPGIEAFTGATGFEYSRNLIKNAAQYSATNPYGIFVNVGGAAIDVDIHQNRVTTTDGLVTTGIRASNAATVAYVTGNNVRGVATPYNLGGAVQHFGNSPGPVAALGSDAAVTIAAGVIDLTTAKGGIIVVAGEGGLADDLVTINGGVSGQTILMRRSAAVNITLKHGTGNIFLDGAADKVLGGAFDTVMLYKAGSNWIGGFYADI